MARARTGSAAPGSGASRCCEARRRLLERLRGGGDQRETAGAMNAAQRVTRAHHRRRRLLLRVELQHLELVRQRRKMLKRFLDEDTEEHRGERDVADGDFVRGAGGGLRDAHRISGIL